MRSCLLPELQRYGGVGGQSQRLSEPRPCRTQTQRTQNFRIRAAALTIPSNFTKVRAIGLMLGYDPREYAELYRACPVPTLYWHAMPFTRALPVTSGFCDST